MPRKSARLDIRRNPEGKDQGANPGESRWFPAPAETRLDSMTYSDSPRQFVRSRNQRMLAGVCGGVAEYFGVDVNLVRAAAVVGAFVSAGTVALIYLAAWMIMPSD